MNKAYTYIIFILLLIILPANVLASDPREVRWHNEATDTTTINRILVKATDLCASNPNQLVEFIGREFIGTPYKSGTLEGSPEALTVNLEEMDCTTFVETVVALALTVENHRCSWIDFLDMLETIRYRNGYADGYASRLHYISDWVITNTHRGYIKDVTDRIPQSDVQIKTLDFMSRNRSKYPALSDSATFEGIKNMEVGYRSHRFPYIKSARLSSKPIINALKGGDIVALTTKTNGLDVSHVGILVIEKDGPHLLHASSKEDKVVIDKLPLTEYMRKAHQLTGIRVLRLQTQ